MVRNDNFDSLTIGDTEDPVATESDLSTKADSDGGGTSELTNYSSISSESVYSGAVTVYVRSDGADTNDGLSPTNAKATINAAIADAPIQGDQSTYLIVDIGSGTFEATQLSELSLSSVHLTGATDTNGDPATTIDAGTDLYSVRVAALYARLSNLALTGNSGCLRVTNGGIVWANNCTGSGATDNSIEVFDNSRYRDDADCHFDQSAATGDSGCLRVFSSVADINGHYEGDGNGGAVAQCWASGTLFISGTVEIVGEGSGSTDHLIDARDVAHVKTAGAWLAEGAREVFRVRNDAEVKVNDAPNEVDISRRWDIYDGGTGIDDATGERVTAVPKMSGTPDTMVGSFTGARGGWIVFDESTNEFKGYNGSSWVVLG